MIGETFVESLFVYIFLSIFVILIILFVGMFKMTIYANFIGFRLISKYKKINPKYSFPVLKLFRFPLPKLEYFRADFKALSYFLSLGFLSRKKTRWIIDENFVKYLGLSRNAIKKNHDLKKDIEKIALLERVISAIQILFILLLGVGMIILLILYLLEG